MKRRDFINISAITASAGIMSVSCSSAQAINKKSSNDLPDIAKDVSPISLAERKARVAKMQLLLKQENIQALIYFVSGSRGAWSPQLVIKQRC